MYYFVDQVEKISIEEHSQSPSLGTNIPKIHPEGFILKGKKRLVEDLAPNYPDAKDQRLEYGSSSAHTAWWNDVGFDTLLF